MGRRRHRRRRYGRPWHAEKREQEVCRYQNKFDAKAEELKTSESSSSLSEESVKAEERTLMTCPPVVSDSRQHFRWEDKPAAVMTITKRRRCRQRKDAPKDVGAASTEKEVPAQSGHTSDASLSQDGRQAGVRGARAWTGGVRLRQEDTAETKQSTAKEEEHLFSRASKMEKEAAAEAETEGELPQEHQGSGAR